MGFLTYDRDNHETPPISMGIAKGFAPSHLHSAMSTFIEATLPARQFALHETLHQYPSAEFDILRLANGTDQSMSYIWITGDGLEGLFEAIANDSSTERVEVITRLEIEYLVRLKWNTRVQLVFSILLEEGMIMELNLKDGIWRFRILVSDRASVSKTTDLCSEYGIDLEVNRISPLSSAVRRGRNGLSDTQFDTILRAYHEGFYCVPRGTTCQDLAADLGISHQALSERLRRGHATLIENTLSPEIEPALQASLAD